MLSADIICSEKLMVSWRGKLEENSGLQGTDNAQGQIIRAKWRLLCLKYHPSNSFQNMNSFIWAYSLKSWGAFRPIAYKQINIYDELLIRV